MEAMLNEEELRLLAYLHENATGYTKLQYFRPHLVREAIGSDDDQMKKMLTYLDGFGFVEIDSWVAGEQVVFFHLTSIGEAYIRKVEAALVENGTLERGKKLGIAVLKGSLKIIMGVAQK